MKVPFFVFFLSFLSRFNNDISKTVWVLTVILAQNWCLSHHGALRLLSVFLASNSSCSIKSCGYYPLQRTPFSNFVCMCTCSLVPRPNTTIIGLGTRLVHTSEIVSSLVPRLSRNANYTPVEHPLSACTSSISRSGVEEPGKEARSLPVIVGKAYEHRIG